jgi:hypothetical protein
MVRKSNMKYSKLMKERIRRVRVLFKELGYDIFEGEKHEESYSAGIDDNREFQCGYFIDNDSKFLELVFTFSFSIKLGPYVRGNLEEMIKICYEYGCYINLFTSEEEITFSVFSKLYYAGLNYYSLRDTLNDFKACVEDLKILLNIQTAGEEEEDEDS